MDDEEYGHGLEGGEEGKVLTPTPRQLRARRAAYYVDRKDCRGRCSWWFLCFWDILLSLERLLRVFSIILASLVTQNIAIKKGHTIDWALGEGFLVGVAVFAILYCLKEVTFRCSNEKHIQRTIRDESNPCVQLVFFLNLLVLIIIIGVYGGAKCEEGTACFSFIMD
jgi:hypothetical protein